MRERLKKIFPMDVNFELKNYAEYFKKSNLDFSRNTSEHKIFFLDAASYNNLGDQAIAYAMSNFIRDYTISKKYVEVSEIELLRNLAFLKKYIGLEDIICLSGGGNMGNRYPRYESIRRKVVKAFPMNKIVIFPQTIDFDNDLYGQRELHRSELIYNSHNNLIICAREEKSYDFMCRYYKNVILVPDIVFYLKKSYFMTLANSNIREKVGICLREDSESILNKTDKILLNSVLENNFDKLTILSTINNTNKKINQYNRKKILEEKFREFSQCKLIVTDRLHGMIFSIITQTPCLIINNGNGKVVGVYEMIKKNINYVDVLNIIEPKHIENKIKNILQQNKNDLLNEKEMYSNLISEIR